MALRGYLPPEGTQNIHQTPYRYREGQRAHQVGRSIIESPPEVILTADEFAQREAERYDLDEVSEETARKALAVYQDNGDVASVLSGGESGGSGGDDGSADGSQADDLTKLTGVGPATDDALRDAGYGSFDGIREGDAAAIGDAVDGLSESDVEDLQGQLAE